MTGKRPHIAIVGAGPIGLEAALYAVDLGHRVDVYERGTIADNVRRWGHVRLFSPFGLNASGWGRRALREIRSIGNVPRDDELLTGAEFVERYLVPLSRLPHFVGCIHEHVEVRRIARSHCLKGDLIGKPERGRDRFQLLLADRHGEQIAFADYVFDCSGTFGNHNWAGAGGMPAVGETTALTPDNYLLPDVTGRDRRQFAGKTTLVVGSGYSAATSIVALAQLAESEPNTRAIWLTRAERPEPIDRIAGDVLGERDSLAEAANRLATSRTGPIDWRSNCLLKGIERDATSGGFRVEVQRARHGHDEFFVDNVIANVGYRPDRSLYEELQIHECYASGGPMKLAAALLGETSADCLAQASPGPQAMANPEPGFFILGAKSYGRDSRFLIKTGLQQISDVFSLISGERGAGRDRSHN